MGERANYLVVADGRTRLFYSHWGGVRIEADVIAGPVAATRYAQAQRPVTDLLDDLWAEGGFLVDHDARVLLLFTSCGGFAQRAAFLAVLRRTWPGWEIRWAYDGAGDFAAYTGADRATVRTPSTPADPETHAVEPMDPDAPEEAAVVTVAGPAGTRVHAVEGYGTAAGDLLGYGPALIGALADDPPDAPPGGFATTPRWGIHLDPARRRVAAWTMEPMPGAAAADRLDAWPGWEWTFWRDRYDEQCRDGAVVLPPPDVPAALPGLGRMLDTQWDADPVARFREVMAKLAETGRDVRPTVWTQAHTPADPLPEERAAVRAALAGCAVSPEPPRGPR